MALDAPGPDDIVVEIAHTGISTGTEKLFWSGKMPPFPGMGYPLIPGYEAVGEVVRGRRRIGAARRRHRLRAGGELLSDRVRGLFGGAARRLVTHPDRALKVDRGAGRGGALLALAATARHAIAGVDRSLPDLIVGHGVLGPAAGPPDDRRRRARADGLGDQPGRGGRRGRL